MSDVFHGNVFIEKNKERFFFLWIFLFEQHTLFLGSDQKAFGGGSASSPSLFLRNCSKHQLWLGINGLDDLTIPALLCLLLQKRFGVVLIDNSNLPENKSFCFYRGRVFHHLSRVAFHKLLRPIVF